MLVTQLLKTYPKLLYVWNTNHNSLSISFKYNMIKFLNFKQGIENCFLINLHI